MTLQELVEFHDTVVPSNTQVQVADLIEAYNRTRQDLSVEDLRRRLDEATAKVGTGHFCFMVSSHEDGWLNHRLIITHWTTPTNPVAVAHANTMDELLAQLEAYLTHPKD